MRLSLFCIFIAFALAYAPKAIVAVAMAKLPGGYDNRHPRDQQAQLAGWGKRALAAHQNSFESFPPFAAAVLVTYVVGASPGVSNALALTYVGSRVFYQAAYIANWHVIRSAVWSVGILAIAALFLLPMWP